MERKRPQVTSFTLHIMAMAFMLCDHLWATVVPGNGWLACIGRMAFPIFAFMIVEGYFHTGNLKKYTLRLFLFALLSEVPFNLMMGGGAFYPLHQNVLWTFLIGLGLIRLNETAKGTGKVWVRLLTLVGTAVLACVLGMVTMVDYYHAGVLTVLAFYCFRGRAWWNYAGQLLALAYINLELLGGLSYEILLAGQTIWFPQQAFALLALIPIWLYRGRQGPYNRLLKYIYYAFYPAHLLVLGLLQVIF